MDEQEIVAKDKNSAMVVWGVCVTLLLGPALLAWVVRGGPAVMACAPGPGTCQDMTFGGGLRDTLALAWIIPTNTFLLITLSLTATMAAFCDRRPMLGTLSFFFLPLLSLALPTLVVYLSMYDGCEVNSDGVGNCMLWGARMGRSFHSAALGIDLIIALAPYLTALTVMLGILGWFFAHPRHRPKPRVHTSMEMRQFGDQPYYGQQEFEAEQGDADQQYYSDDLRAMRERRNRQQQQEEEPPPPEEDRQYYAEPPLAEPPLESAPLQPADRPENGSEQ
jgi:hypothetical protein